MANSKKTDKKIRESFESTAPKAPQGIWDAMEGQLPEENALDQQLKDAFEKDFKAAPEQVWQGINRQLSIDRAWVGINRYLNWQIAYRWTARVAALILLLIGLQWWSGFNEESNPLIQIDLREESQESIRGKANTLSRRAASIQSSSPVNQEASTNSQGSANQRFVSISNAEENEVAEVSREDFYVLPLDSIEESRIQLYPREIKSINFNRPILGLFAFHSNPEEETKSEQKAIIRSNATWEVGFEYSFNQDFLSNNIYRESQDPRSLIRANSVYSHNYKAFLRYNPNQQWSFSLSYQPQRSFRLDYNTYREGQFVAEDMALEFHRIGLGLDHRIPLGSARSPWFLNLGLEPYYGLLSNAEYLGNDISSNYSDAWGMEMRIGQEWSSGSMILAYGLKTDFNFNNVFVGDARIPASFDRTLYRSWALFLSARYRIFKAR